MDLVHVAPALKRLWVVIVRISDHFFRLRHEVREATCDVVEVAAASLGVDHLARSATTYFADRNELSLLPDGIDLCEAALQLFDCHFRSDVLRLVIL